MNWIRRRWFGLGRPLPQHGQMKMVDGERWDYVSRQVAIEDRWARDVLKDLTAACDKLDEPFLLSYTGLDDRTVYEVQGWLRASDR